MNTVTLVVVRYIGAKHAKGIFGWQALQLHFKYHNT